MKPKAGSAPRLGQIARIGSEVQVSREDVTLP